MPKHERSIDDLALDEAGLVEDRVAVRITAFYDEVRVAHEQLEKEGRYHSGERIALEQRAAATALREIAEIHRVAWRQLIDSQAPKGRGELAEQVGPRLVAALAAPLEVLERFLTRPATLGANSRTGSLDEVFRRVVQEVAIDLSHPPHANGDGGLVRAARRLADKVASSLLGRVILGALGKFTAWVVSRW